LSIPLSHPETISLYYTLNLTLYQHIQSLSSLISEIGNVKTERNTTLKSSPQIDSYSDSTNMPSMGVDTADRPFLLWNQGFSSAKLGTLKEK
jgi:hypothetical protein